MNYDHMSREELIAEAERLSGLVKVFSNSDFTKLQDGILNNLQGAVMATDTDMRIIYWNRYSEQMHQSGQTRCSAGTSSTLGSPPRIARRRRP